jgi:phosphatase NudJ
MARAKTQTINVVLVVVRRGDRFLLVQEAHERSPGLWYVPAGGVEAGETIAEAAHREVMEEAGATVRLTGLLRVEQSLWTADNGTPSARWRFVFTAEPTADSGLKTEPDAESLGAAWFTREQVAGLPLRSDEVLDLLDASLTDPVLPTSALKLGRWERRF